MPEQRKILILSLPRRGQVKTKPRRIVRRQIRPYLRILLWTLKKLGFRLSTIGDALAAPQAAYGRFACLTFDDLDLRSSLLLLPECERLRVPATAFVATAQGHFSATHLKRLVANGWEIGTLGHEPVYLTEQSSAEQLRLISEAKALLTEQLGTPPTVFAYPFGAYDATTVSCVRDEGFTAAVTLRPGINGMNGPIAGDADQLHLKRVPLSGGILRDLWTITRIALSSSRDAVAPAIGATISGESAVAAAVTTTPRSRAAL